jgi:AAA15 family ATPase/GTPase
MRNWYLNNRFKLPVEDENKPITMVVEFENNSQAYIYCIEIDIDGVKSESLLLSGLGKSNHVVFQRDRESVAFKKARVVESIKKILERQIADNPFGSVLAINGVLHLTEDEHMRNAFLWFLEKLEVVEISRDIPWLIEHFKDNADMMNFVGEIFTKVGLGIQSLYIKDESFDQWLKNVSQEEGKVADIMTNKGLSLSKMIDDVPMLTVTEEDGKRLVREFVFQQIGRNGSVCDMDVMSQSTGTLRLLTLIPAIYFAINNEKTVLIDEIDNGIHPMLIKNLVKFFGESKSNGQLIYTTHETALLNQQELLRPDEVWFVEKVEGCTKMYSLNDFKIHKTISIENGYLDGRFGAIPFIGTL